VLLDLAFDSPLVYADYCEIEDAGGGPPRGVLRSVLLRECRFASYLPWILTTSAGHGTDYGPLMEALAEQGIPATEPLTVLQRYPERMRPAHRPVMYDIAVRYLCAYAEDASEELKRRGYLTETLEVIFPGDQRAQRLRLQAALVFVYGGSPRWRWVRLLWNRALRGSGRIGLSRAQVRRMFDNPGLVPTPAFEAAAGHLAPSRKARRLITDQAAHARLTSAGHPDDSRLIPHATPERSLTSDPDTIRGFPKYNVYATVIILIVALLYILFLYVTGLGDGGVWADLSDGCSGEWLIGQPVRGRRCRSRCGDVFHGCPVFTERL
jgi:hypothetical protein